MPETAQLTDAGRVLLGVSVTVVVAAVAMAARRPGDARMSRWAECFGLALTATNRPLLSAYLRRTQLFRAAGAGVGWLANPVWIALRERPFPLGGNSLALAFGGYLLGAVLAEVTLARPAPPAGARTASLVPRALGDYVSPSRVWAIRLLPLLTVGLAVVYGAMPRDDRFAEHGVGFVLAVAALLVGFAAVVEVVLRMIVGRAQPTSSAEVVAFDDAVRAGSIHALAGAAVGMLLAGAGWAASVGGMATTTEPLHTVLGVLALVAFAAATAMCALLVRPQGWRVRRHLRVEAGA